ncbi:membrane protein [Nocardioides sp. OK12]|uniref:DMT family transporter n=1 Tax=Nocardioides sp. OK12 TaxID=2758661 RepID=UPI0021C45A8F|nr:DMT family transporter [Nocardioides sp. OK12]GHJ59495.1 membrane protein [Nocardioides sp. OK12]
MSTSARWGVSQIALAAFLWGTGGLVVQLVREQVPLSVPTISAWRLALALAALLAVVLAQRTGGRLLALLRARPRRVLAVGLATAGYQLLYFLAVTWAGVTVATVVSLGLAPVLLGVSEAVTARRAPSPTRLLVVTAALAGLALVSTSTGHGGGGVGPRPLAGLLVAVAAGVLYALATGWGGALARDTPPLVLTTATTGVGAVALVPVALLGGGPQLTGDPAALALLAYLGLFTMAGAYAAFYAGLRTTSGSTAALVTLVEPLSAALLAAVVLGERLGPGGVVGTVLILGAVAGLARDDGDAVAASAGPTAALPGVPPHADPH